MSTTIGIKALPNFSGKPGQKSCGLWPAVLWALVIFATSSTVVTTKQLVKTVASNTVVQVSSSGFDAFWREYWWVFVKGYHALEYMTLFLLLNKGLSSKADWTFERRWRLSLLLTIFYAATDEYHQTFVPGRGGLVSDVLIDTGGAVAAAFFVLWLERRKFRK
ncbi:MAG: VanZ family protein [Fimbriimonadaceae bacterium]|nr:VanZ family protein [Fimbriimonadaceae bacterium]